MAKEKITYAKDCECSKKSCKEMSDVFIQGNDPDLSLNIPFCRKHADEYRLFMMMISYGDKKYEDLEKWLNK